jgi:LPXTG-motif cell wall-anchored protein
MTHVASGGTAYTAAYELSIYDNTNNAILKLVDLTETALIYSLKANIENLDPWNPSYIIPPDPTANDLVSYAFGEADYTSIIQAGAAAVISPDVVNTISLICPAVPYVGSTATSAVFLNTAFIGAMDESYTGHFFEGKLILEYTPTFAGALTIDGVDTMQTGEQASMNAVFDSPPSYDGVYWISDNPGVAMVNHAGLVTGISAGTATISAKAMDGSWIYASKNVRVAGDLSVPATGDGSMPMFWFGMLLFAGAGFVVISKIIRKFYMYKD